MKSAYMRLSSRTLCLQRTYMGFIVTRTLPPTYVYGIYRHAPSYWNDSMRFRIIVYTHVTMATGCIYIYIYIYKLYIYTNMKPHKKLFLKTI